jgi:hypothetical protein
MKEQESTKRDKSNLVRVDKKNDPIKWHYYVIFVAVLLFIWWSYNGHDDSASPKVESSSSNDFWDKQWERSIAYSSNHPIENWDLKMEERRADTQAVRGEDEVERASKRSYT